LQNIKKISEISEKYSSKNLQNIRKSSSNSWKNGGNFWKIFPGKFPKYFENLHHNSWNFWKIFPQKFRKVTIKLLEKWYIFLENIRPKNSKYWENFHKAPGKMTKISEICLQNLSEKKQTKIPKIPKISPTFQNYPFFIELFDNFLFDNFFNQRKKCSIPLFISWFWSPGASIFLCHFWTQKRRLENFETRANFCKKKL